MNEPKTRKLLTILLGVMLFIAGFAAGSLAGSLPNRYRVITINKPSLVAGKYRTSLVKIDTWTGKTWGSKGHPSRWGRWERID